MWHGYMYTLFSYLGTLIESKTAIGTQLPMGATLEIQRQQRVEQLEQQLAWAQFQPRPVERVSVIVIQSVQLNSSQMCSNIYM